MPPSSDSASPKPLLRQGFRVPFGELSSDDLTRFVCSVLGPIGRRHGFRPDSLTGGSGDGGFDIVARRLANVHEIVAIQCKRYEQSLSVPIVAPELAKVALRAKLEGSRVVEHYVISSSMKRTQKLDQALREENRNALIKTACERAAKDPELKSLSKEAQKLGYDPEKTIADYIKTLQKIVAWSGADLDGQLGECWSEVQDTLERHFSLHVLLREHPRPDFAELTYLRKCIEEAPANSVPPFAQSAILPPNLVVHSAANPLADKTSDDSKSKAISTARTLPEILASTGFDSCTILTGPGGAGKTHGLLLTAALVAKQRLEAGEGPIPVVLRLRAYRGDLDQAIRNALGINHGAWLSIPGTFLLLCDGLSELSHEQASHLEGQLRGHLNQQDSRIACVVSLRDTGLRQRTPWPRIGTSLRVAPFHLRQTRALATLVLERADDVEAFMAELERRLSSERAASFLSLPFCLAESLRLYKSQKALPEHLAGLLEAIVQGRLERNHELPLRDDLVGVPKETVRVIAEEIMFAARIERNLATLSKKDMGAIFQHAIKKAQDRDCFGADDLTQARALELLCHYEFLSRPAGGAVHLPHDLLVGYLAAMPLSEAWRSHLSTLANSSADDAWIFAGHHLSEEESVLLVAELVKTDLFVATRAGVETGGRALSLIERNVLEFDRDSADTQFWVWKTAMAMGILQTEACKTRARENACLPADSTLRAVQNRRALALMGDESLILSMIRGQHEEGKDEQECATVDRAFWDYVPPSLALKLARQHLDFDEKRDERSLAQCLELIQALGDESDVERVSRVFDQTRDYFVHKAARHCLHRLSPQHAIERIRRLLMSSDIAIRVRLDWIEWLVSVGEEIDGDWVLRVFLGELDERAPSDEDSSAKAQGGDSKVICILAANILLKTTFTEPMKQRLYAAIETKRITDWRRGSLWIFAGKNDIHEFDAHLMSAIESKDNAEIGAACGFLRYRNISVEERRPFLDALAACVQEPQVVDFYWGGFGILDYLRSNGHEELVVRIGSEWILALLKAHEHLRLGRDAQEIRTVGRLHFEKPLVRRDMEHLFSLVLALIQTLAPLAHQLERTGFEELFHIRLSGVRADDAWSDGLIKIFNLFSVDEIDAKLAALNDDPFEQVALLRLVAPRLGEPRRVEILRPILPWIVDRAGPMATALGILQQYWSEELAEAVIRTIASYRDWDSETDGQFFEDTAHWIGENLAKDWADRLEELLEKEEHHPISQRFLLRWADMASDRRG